MKSKNDISVYEITKRHQVHRLTVLKWLEMGLKHKRTPGGRYKVNVKDLDQFLKEKRHLKRKRILIIDNEKDFIEETIEVLEKDGFMAIPSDNVVDALVKTKSARPEIVLLDLEISESSGWNFAEKVRTDERLKEVPILVMSRKTPAAKAVDKMIDYDAVGFIEKPFEPEDLLRKIKEVLKVFSELT